MTWNDVIAAAQAECAKYPAEYKKRLDFEIKEIDKQGANDHWVDEINSNKKYDTNKNGLVLPFLMGMTPVDPIVSNIPHVVEYQTDFPDVDIDLLPGTREKIEQYAAQVYGRDKVCSVGLWQTYKPKLALQDAARALGKDVDPVITLTKNLPDEFDELDFEEAIKDHAEFKKFALEHKEIVSMAYRMVGGIKAQGRHAGGLIIANVPIEDHIPLTLCSERWTSAWTEGRTPQLSKMGFVKFDMLGLKTLLYIKTCLRLIKQNRGMTIEWTDIDPELDRAGWITDEQGNKTQICLNDPASIAMAHQTRTETVFQFETNLAKRILMHGVKSFDDLVVYTSLGRPGPMPMIDIYVKRRDGLEKWEQDEHPMIAQKLKKTFGVIVYQEDLAEIWRSIGGFTAPETEAARKAVAKKWVEKLVPIKEKWIRGASKTLSTEVAAAWWDKMETFGRYAFNKCLDGSTILEDPITKEQTTIAELYNNPRPFNLLSLHDDKLQPDILTTIHYNGYQPVFEIELSNGIKHQVTMNHKFMDVNGNMRPVYDLFESGSAIKYISISKQDYDIPIDTHDLLDRPEAMQENIGICIRRRKRENATEMENSKCYIESIRHIGVRKTYSPEMKSDQHNYVLNSGNGQPIHANSHATACIIIAQRCLYLKAHFPAEWWAAVMSDCDNDRLASYMGHAKADGVSFGSMDCDKLTMKFSASNDIVTPGLTSIKNMDSKMAEIMTSKDVIYKDIDDFVAQNGKSKVVYERLIKLGAFDKKDKNRKANWVWYQYQYGTDEDSKEIRKLVKCAYAWPLAAIESERQRQAKEFYLQYPKRKKLPPKVEKWVPKVPWQVKEPKLPDSYDETTYEFAKGLQLTREHVMAVVSESFDLEDLLKFERGYLGYTCHSPMDLYVHDTEATIAAARENGILEVYIDKFTLRKKNTEFGELIVTDGIDTARVMVWGDDLRANGDEIFKEGRGVRMRVNWKDKFKSFNLKNGSIAIPLDRSHGNVT